MKAVAVVATALAAALLPAAPIGAQDGDRYADPDVPATHRAAVRALPGERLPIVGRSLGIMGAARGLEAVLEELGAKVTAQEIKIDLAADVLFDFDQADLRADARDELAKVGEVLSAHPGAPVTIEGHTDAKGGDAYNQRLSERRAESVKRWLVQNAAADAGRITTRGWGEIRPVTPNTRPDGSDDPEGRQRNRRVEITLRTG